MSDKYSLTLVVQADPNPIKANFHDTMENVDQNQKNVFLIIVIALVAVMR